MWHVMKESCGAHKSGNGTVIEAVTAAIIPRKNKKDEEEEEQREEEEREEGVSNGGGLELYFHLWKPPRPTVW